MIEEIITSTITTTTITPYSERLIEENKVKEQRSVTLLQVVATNYCDSETSVLPPTEDVSMKALHFLQEGTSENAQDFQLMHMYFLRGFLCMDLTVLNLHPNTTMRYKIQRISQRT